MSMTEAESLGCPEGFEVFVGRMPLGTCDQQLLDLAKPYNPHAVRVLSKPDRAGLMCGFVTFLTVKGAQDFISQCNETNPWNAPQTITIRFADGKTRKKVFFGGLPTRTTEEELNSLASQFGTLLSVKILSRDQKAPCGFVVFANPMHAENCISSLNGTPNGHGKDYVVRFAKAPEPRGSRESFDFRRMGSSDFSQQGHSALPPMHPQQAFQQAYRDPRLQHSFPQQGAPHNRGPPLRDDFMKQNVQTPSTAASMNHNGASPPNFGGLGNFVGQHSGNYQQGQFVPAQIMSPSQAMMASSPSHTFVPVFPVMQQPQQGWHALPQTNQQPQQNSVGGWHTLQPVAQQPVQQLAQQQ